MHDMSTQAFSLESSFEVDAASRQERYGTQQ
jgi:hypothetical protein